MATRGLENKARGMISITQEFGQRWMSYAAVSVALACSACASVPQTAKTHPPETGTFQAIYQEKAEPAGHVKTNRRPRNEISNQQEAPPAISDQQKYRDPAFQQISHVESTGPAYTGTAACYEYAARGVTQASLQNGPTPNCPDQFCPPESISSCPPVPRFPAAGPNPLAMGMMACDVCNLPNAETYSDEYLCDGGDRDIPVHYDSFSRVDLDTEDTVIEFTDKRGNERVKPSNRVCLYAPRFASVRTVSQPYEGLKTHEIAGLEQRAVTGGLHARLKSSQEMKRDAVGGIAVRSRPSGLESESYQGTLSQRKAAAMHDKLVNAFESLTFVRTGRINDAEMARLKYGIQAAAAWNREEYPVIAVKVDMAMEGHYEQQSATITAIEEGDEAENLRIVKLADKQTAQPGEEVLFTIRYDNLGGREVYHVRIVDNLTPRLDYIPDSATSDRDGQLVLQDNGEGSFVLVWEFEEPLPRKSGGVVTFKARVR